MAPSAIIDELYVLLFLSCASKGCAGFFKPSEPIEPNSMEAWSERMASEAEKEGWEAKGEQIFCPACASKIAPSP